MQKRSVSILVFLAVLVFSASLFGPKTQVRAALPAAAGTASSTVIVPTPTSVPGADFVAAPLSGSVPLAVQFTALNASILLGCTWTFGDGTSQSFSAGTVTGSNFTLCPSVTHTYSLAGSYSVSLTVTKITGRSNSMTKPNYVVVLDAGTVSPTAVSTNDLLPDLTITSINFIGSNPQCANSPRDSVVVSNIGSGPAGTFVVAFGSQTQTVNGLASGQQVTLTFTAINVAMATADSTNVISESNETNNSLTVQLAVPTQAFTCTPTGGPSLTPTRTPTPTPTATGSAGLCSPVSATITAPFTFDGAGSFCWKASSLGSYINSWNLAGLTINGVSIANSYVPSASYPAKANGFWYISYTGNFPWSHFETK